MFLVNGLTIRTTFFGPELVLGHYVGEEWVQSPPPFREKKYFPLQTIKIEISFKNVGRTDF